MNLQEKLQNFINQREFHKLQAQTLDGAVQAITSLLEEEAAEAAADSEPEEEEGEDAD